MTATTVTVQAGDLIDGLKSVIPFVSKDKDLPVFASVHVKIEDGKVTLETTDRFRAGLWELREPQTQGAGEWLLDGADVKTLLATLKPKAKERSLWVTLTQEGGDVVRWRWWQSDGLSGTLRTVEGDYPRLDRLVPPGAPAASVPGRIAFDPKYLADFAKVSRGEDGDPLTLEWAHPHKPIRVRIGRQFTGLIMPIRA